GTLEGGHATGNQPNTDHHETAADVKVEHWFDRNERLVFLHQRLRQNDVPRTHATIFGESYAGTTVGTDLQRDLDQQRSLTYLQYHRTGQPGAVGGLHLSLSWQQQRELEDRVTSANVERWQAFDVGTLGASAQFDSDAGTLGRLTWGVELYHDEVNSWFRRSSGGTAADPIQGQVGNDASYDLLAAYAQDLVALGDATELQLGVRYTYAAADADSVRDPSTNARIAIADDWDEFTASAHLRHDLLPGRWNVHGGVSQGFRAPSLADLTLFDTARSGELEVPSPGLEAEHYLGYEVGTKVRCGDITVQAAWFYTDIEDQILRYPTGQTSGTSAIVTKENVGDGYVQGAELQFGWQFLPRTTLFGAGTWQYGRVSNYNQGAQRGEEFVSRLMPFTAMLGLRWQSADGRLHAETLVGRAEDADKTSAGDNRDTQRIPPGGTPGYTAWTVRGGWQATDSTDLELALENVTDVDYRVHGSGSNAPGRSFVVGMRTTF
ncbi:MAG: TonB-dependent receptor, partial [Planctomycetes bacterium]|nr:TonB-dependent receptor [Planctomycetota bacterium]